MKSIYRFLVSFTILMPGVALAEVVNLTTQVGSRLVEDSPFLLGGLGQYEFAGSDRRKF